MKLAKDLLENTDIIVADVACAVGYDQPTEIFKMFGKTMTKNYRTENTPYVRLSVMLSLCLVFAVFDGNYYSV